MGRSCARSPFLSCRRYSATQVGCCQVGRRRAPGSMAESEVRDPGAALTLAGIFILALSHWQHDAAPHRTAVGVVPNVPRWLRRFARSGDGPVYVWSLVNGFFGALIALTGLFRIVGAINSAPVILAFLLWPAVSLTTWAVIELVGRARSGR